MVRRNTLPILLVLSALAASPDAAVAASGVNFTVGEAVAFTKRVADIESCVFDSATIAWGDGTSSAGQFDSGTTPGVKGTHTYASEGTYEGTVTYSTDCTSNGVVGFTATVQDAPLSAEGRDVEAVKEQSVTAVVAHFTDASPNDPPSDFSAQISWGDGGQSPGTVSAASGGGFDVTGTHTYQSVGQAAVNVTIQSVGGSSASTSSTARIAAEPLVASFTYSPALPCTGRTITFDASGSGPGVTRYEWSWTDTATEGLLVDPGPFVLTDPVYQRSFGFNNTSNEWVVGNQIRLRRPPIIANLAVTDNLGRTASAPPQTISFADPDVPAVVKRKESGITFYGWPIYIIYAEPLEPTPCYRPSSRFRLALGDIPSRTATVKGTDSVTAEVTCGVTKQCGGTLFVRRFGKSRGATTEAAGRRARLLGQRATTRAAGRRARLLGQRAINLPPGESIKVKIPLNKRGRNLAKQRWNRVTLAWASPRGKALVRTLKLRRAGR
jgi:hypothetical protein